MDFTENVIEWITGDKTVMTSFSQKKYVNRVKKMAKKYPEQIEICAENSDGSITAKMPLKAIHLTIYDSRIPGQSETETEDEKSEYNTSNTAVGNSSM